MKPIAMADRRTTLAVAITGIFITAAGCIGLARMQASARIAALYRGEYQLLYLAPERLLQTEFLAGALARVLTPAASLRS